MAIVFKHTPDGGFLCGDTETGLTAYAFATSPNEVASRKNPARVAAKMLAGERPRNAYPPLAESLATDDAERIARLTASVKE